MGRVAEDKTIVNVVIEKKDREILDQLRKEENRSLSNMINYIIKQYIAQKAPK